MKVLSSSLPTFKKNQWDIINSNGVGVGSYNPMNWVVIDNILIQSKNNMKNIEQKLLEFIISLIDIKKPVRRIIIKKKDAINFLFPGTIGKKSTEFTSYYYSRFKKAYRNLGQSGVIIKNTIINKEAVVPFCAFVEIDTDYIEAIFYPEILPFLCFLEGNFTKYKIGYIKKLNGNYSIHLYKYFIMKVNIRKNNKKILWQEDLKDLRFMLNIEKKYKQFNDIKKYILDPAIKEINKHTDIRVEYNIIRGGVKNIQILALEFKAEKLYKETAIEKSKNKNNIKIPKETFSKTQNSTEEEVIPVAICVDTNTSETVKNKQKQRK